MKSTRKKTAAKKPSPPIEEGRRLLPLMQLARRWGWSRSKLYRLVKARAIPVIRMGERNDCFFDEAAIEAWLAEQTVPAKDSTPAAAPREDGYDDEAELRRFGLTREDCAFLDRPRNRRRIH